MAMISVALNTKPVVKAEVGMQPVSFPLAHESS
jgi:hypothetical protein